jgi:hypothetical protein
MKGAIGFMALLNVANIMDAGEIAGVRPGPAEEGASAASFFSSSRQS